MMMMIINSKNLPVHKGKVTDNIVNMWWEMFQYVYAQIVPDNISERMTKTA